MDIVEIHTGFYTFTTYIVHLSTTKKNESSNKFKKIK